MRTRTNEPGLPDPDAIDPSPWMEREASLRVLWGFLETWELMNEDMDDPEESSGYHLTNMNPRNPEPLDPRLGIYRTTMRYRQNYREARRRREAS